MCNTSFYTQKKKNFFSKLKENNLKSEIEFEIRTLIYISTLKNKNLKSH